MSPEAQRIAIAEACGWRRDKLNDSDKWWHPDGTFIGRFDLWALPSFLPDWPKDLNAAITLCDHLAEEGWRASAQRLTSGQWQFTFVKLKTSRSCDTHTHEADTLGEAICGAFLRTRGLWIEGGEA